MRETRGSRLDRGASELTTGSRRPPPRASAFPHARALFTACLVASATHHAFATPTVSLDALVTRGACVSPTGTPNGDHEPVLLRVAPWVGNGAQVTLGLGWGDPSFGDDDAVPSTTSTLEVFAVSEPTNVVASYAEENDEQRSETNSLHSETLDASWAPQTNGATAVVLVMAKFLDASSKDSKKAALQEQVTAVLTVVDSLPGNELVSVWALSANSATPVLLSDFRSKRLGGRRHVRRRLTELLLMKGEALESSGVPIDRSVPVKTLPELPFNKSTYLSNANTDWRRESFANLVTELALWRDDAEGPVARDLVIVSFEKFDTKSAVDEYAPDPKQNVQSISRESNREPSGPVSGALRGGRWSLTWAVQNALGTIIESENYAIVSGWSAASLANRAQIVTRRRQSIIRVGVCFGGSGLTSAESENKSSPSEKSIEFRVRADTTRVRKTTITEASFGVSCVVPSPSFDSVFHLATTECVASESAADVYPYPDAVTLRMSVTERTVFDSKRSYYKGTYLQSLNAKQNMKMDVQFGDASALPSRDGGDGGDGGDAPAGAGFFGNSKGTPGDGTGNETAILKIHPGNSRSLPITAKTRFRGVSSLRDCERRKSLSVNLSGKTKIRLAPGSASDKFLLISMCYDDRYVKTKLVLSLAAELGAFPHQTRYVRLLVENKLKISGAEVFENNGLYLLVDDPTTALERQHLRLGAVVRRRNDALRVTEPGKGTPDVKFPESDDEEESENLEIETREKYDEIATLALTCGESCYARLDQKIDLEQYLRWTSLMTLVGSGDHVDETWFYASDEAVFTASHTKKRETETENEKNWRFQTHAWDPDDAFQNCHHDGENALFDRYGLLICAEGDLDKAFLGDEALYGAFVDTLEWTVREAVTPGRVSVIVEAMRAEINSTLINDATAKGLEELIKQNPNAGTKQAALDDINESLSFYEWTLLQRRREILRKIARYREDVATSSEGVTSNQYVKSPTRMALDRYHRESPVKVDKYFKRVTFQSKDKTKGSLFFTAKSAEYRLDAEPGAGFQELVFSQLKFANEGEYPYDAAAASLSKERGPTVTIPIHQNVTYGNVTYRAPSVEIRVACVSGGSGDGNATAVFFTPPQLSGADAGSDAFSRKKNSCVLPDSQITDANGTVVEIFDARVFVAFTDGAVSMRFARGKTRLIAPTEETGDSDSIPVSVPRGFVFSANENKISVHHRDWLPFPQGVLRA